MKIGERWLREWARAREPTEALAEALTMGGLEVAALTPAAAGVKGVVVARIDKVEAHPNADRLRVCEVDAGRRYTVVCGAANARAGLRAALAPPGASLPGGVDIAERSIRGARSQGMLCAARELGLGDDEDQLLELPEDAPLGEDFGRWLGLDETLIDLDLTPNRGDCLSARGLARDLSALLGRAFKDQPWRPVAPRAKTRVAVKVSAPDDCPVYLGRVVENIRAAARAPLWMRERLRRCGVRSVNAAVDVGNYVMLELGQPLHMFDLDRLKGGVEVRRARKGERLKTLDGAVLKLGADDLLIADDAGPAALAGVMGGADSGVSADTRSVFIESAHFAPAALAGRARHHRVDSEAARRFERGVDPTLPRRALERAAQLLTECAGGDAGPVEGVERERPTPAAIKLGRDYLARVLGLKLKDATVAAMLRRLGLDVKTLKSGWSVAAPAHRPDLRRREDLAEEVARLHGYDKIPQVALRANCVFSPPPAFAARMMLRRQMATLGYGEIVGYSLISAEDERRFHGVEAPIELRNPLSEDMGALRGGLLAGLARALARNCRHNQSEDGRWFEIGRCFAAARRPEEREWLAAIACGRRGGWGQSERVDFYDLKGDMLAALEAVGGDWSLRATSDARFEFAAAVHRDGDESPCGRIGMLDARLLAELGLESPVGYWEIDTAALRPEAVTRVEAPLRQPALTRDLAVVVDENIPAERVGAVIEDVYASKIKGLGGVPENLVLFDVYAGEGVGDGMRSLAFHLRFRHPERAFRDAEAQRVLDEILRRLDAEFGAKQRE